MCMLAADNDCLHQLDHCHWWGKLTCSVWHCSGAGQHRRSATKSQQKCRHFQYHGSTPDSSPVMLHGGPSETCGSADRKLPPHFCMGLTRKRGKRGCSWALQPIALPSRPMRYSVAQGLGAPWGAAHREVRCHKKCLSSLKELSVLQDHTEEKLKHWCL